METHIRSWHRHEQSIAAVGLGGRPFATSNSARVGRTGQVAAIRGPVQCRTLFWRSAPNVPATRSSFGLARTPPLFAHGALHAQTKRSGAVLSTANRSRRPKAAYDGSDAGSWFDIDCSTRPTTRRGRAQNRSGSEGSFWAAFRSWIRPTDEDGAKPPTSSTTTRTPDAELNTARDSLACT